MHWIVTFAVLLSLTGCTEKHEEIGMQHDAHHGHHLEHQHGQHGNETSSQLMVATDPAEPAAGQPVTLRLMIHAADGPMVKDFGVTHEEKVHLVIVRDALDHFDHIHPRVDGDGNLSIEHTFPVGGKYLLFADYAPVGGKHATAKGTLVVGGEVAPAPQLGVNAPGDIEADDVAATTSASSLQVGAPTRMAFALEDEEGRPAVFEKYLIESGYLMFIGDEGGDNVYVHSLGGKADADRVGSKRLRGF